MTDKQRIRAEQRAITQRIGRNLRNLRIAKGWNQTKLGEALGVAFQQIQKYENGSNRLSPAGLCMASEVLGVPVSAFFEGVAEKKASENHFSRASLEMVRDFNSVTDERLKRAFMTLIKVIAKNQSHH